MESNWTPVSFSDAVNLNPTVKMKKGEEYPFVDMKSVDPTCREVSFSELRAFKNGGAKFLPKDTLMARITPCLENGKIVRYMPSGRNGEAFGSTEFIVIRGKNGVTDNDFAYYLTMWPEFREFAISQMTGSSGRQRVPVDSLAGFNFNLPPLPEQKAIAHILGSLDDKIELNRRMNETLEAMAQALFKSWFIDFDPVLDNAILAGNPIPDELAERAEIRRAILDQNQPSPPTPLPEVEGRYASHSQGVQYRGGFEFSGLLETARELRKKQTPAEEVMWELFRNRNFMGLKFRRQHQIGEYIADFYCHDAKIVIELDGKIHEQKTAKDKKRDAYMQSIGLTVLRVTNEEFLSDPETVLSKIAGCLPDHIRQLFPSEFEHTEEMGWIPKGWRVSAVGEEFDVTMGQSPLGSTYNEMGEGIPFFQGRADFGFRYPSERVYCTAPKRFAEQNDTLVSVRAPVGDVNMALDKSCIGRGVGAVRHKSHNRSYTYYSMLQLRENFNKFEAEGTVFGSISKKDFKALKWLRSDKFLLEIYEKLAGQFDEKIEVCSRNILALTNCRDTLLPKLLSGEVRVGESGKIVEELG